MFFQPIRNHYVDFDLINGHSFSIPMEFCWQFMLCQGPHFLDDAGQVSAGPPCYQPGSRVDEGRYPFTDPCGFIKPAGGRDQRQAARQALVQTLDQARTEDNFRSKPGN